MRRIALNHGEHESTKDCQLCLTCNPRKLRLSQYEQVVAMGADPRKDLPSQQYAVGDSVTIKPTPQSLPLFGTVTHIAWQDAFADYAYMIAISSGKSTMAWESEIARRMCNDAA